MLSLHLLQVSLVYVNTLMMQQVLAEPAWQGRLTLRDRACALTTEVAAHQSVRHVHSEHAGAATARASGVSPWLYFAAMTAFARLRPNTRAGSRFADKTRQALAFDQLRSRRTHIIA